MVFVHRIIAVFSFGEKKSKEGINPLLQILK